jgi:HTH-type transcriptional regulator / antitoxin HigA
MKTARIDQRTPLPSTFEELHTMHQLRPIRDEVDYDNAVEMLDRLAVLDRRTPDQEDYLETLAALVGRYDDEHYAEDLTQLSPLDSLKYLMERHEMNGSQLGDLLGGNRSLGGKILRGERQLSKAHIRTLAERFKVSPALFL